MHIFSSSGETCCISFSISMLRSLEISHIFSVDSCTLLADGVQILAALCLTAVIMCHHSLLFTLSLTNAPGALSFSFCVSVAMLFCVLWLSVRNPGLAPALFDQLFLPVNCNAIHKSNCSTWLILFAKGVHMLICVIWSQVWMVFSSCPLFSCPYGSTEGIEGKSLWTGRMKRRKREE